MANFILTAGVDTPTGAPGVADNFLLGAPGTLSAADTLAGGTGAVADVLVVQAAMTLAAADFANVRDIERITITAAAGAAVTLADAMAASGDLAFFHVFGGTGADSIDGALVAARALNLLGGAGDDWILGGGGGDLIGTGSGADTAFGGAGNDTFSSLLADIGPGDVLDGGAGSLDVLRLTSAGGQLRDAALRGFERIEVAAAVATGLVYRLAGETAATAAAPLTVVGAAGADAIVATAAAAAVVLLGEGGTDRLVGGLGADLLHGGTGADTLHGFAGDDTLEGGEGDDRLAGAAGNDLLRGGTGNDSLSGGTGNDTVEAGGGADTVDGGFGNDWLRFAALDLGAGDRIIDEQGSADVLEVVGAAGVSIGAGVPALVLGIERFILGSGNDVVVIDSAIADSAGAGVVTVEGGAGNDQLNASAFLPLAAPLRALLRGGDGLDTLIGGTGADTLDSGAGAVRATGGAGDDLIIVAPGEIAASTINGGTGFADVLRLSEGGAVAAGDLAGTSNVEVIEFSPEGNTLTLTTAFVSALVVPLEVRGGDGDDLLDASGLVAGEQLLVELGAGDDTFLSSVTNSQVRPGSGADLIVLGTGGGTAIFGAGEFSALDTVTAATTGEGARLEVALTAGRTLGAAAFDGISGIDVMTFVAASGAAVRLPNNAVSQSGEASIRVFVSGDAGVAVDGRMTGRINYLGGQGDDLLLGGPGVDTLRGAGGSDTIRGGDGGDLITLEDAVNDDYALITSLLDGTGDINGNLTASELAAADRVSGTASQGNYIAVDWEALGLANGTTFALSGAEAVGFGNGAALLPTSVGIADNAFGSLAAVRTAVGARMDGGTIGADVILVIGGADDTEFGVYYFRDGDNNATIDAADMLRLLAIGSGDVPTFASERGFRLVDLDLV